MLSDEVVVIVPMVVVVTIFSPLSIFIDQHFRTTIFEFFTEECKNCLFTIPSKPSKMNYNVAKSFRINFKEEKTMLERKSKQHQ